MRLESVQELKSQLIADVVRPAVKIPQGAARASRILALRGGPPIQDAMSGVKAQPMEAIQAVPRFLALGIAPHGKGYRLAVRLQRASLQHSPVVEYVMKRAKGEVDLRMVGRIDKRLPRAATAGPWYQGNTRPLLIGASIGHVDVTAGTIGGFVQRNGAICVLSNNHVLANEDRARKHDAVLQRAALDGGRRGDTVARLEHWIKLKRARNLCDVALAVLEPGIEFDPSRLSGVVSGRNRALSGVGPEFIDASTVVYKVGRTTGATRGRVSAFDLEYVVVNYDRGNLSFDGQIEIESTTSQPFSDGGDSGSLIVNREMEAVGLLFAGTEVGGRRNTGLTYASPINAVLRNLNGTLLW